ncbi:MAG TPA: hypothetical protein DHV08_00130, partial [Rhodocyclaceae bacterium]|nr:hypothetical protein [Rhodocyclaceae bacterium]
MPEEFLHDCCRRRTRIGRHAGSPCSAESQSGRELAERLKSSGPAPMRWTDASIPTGICLAGTKLARDRVRFETPFPAQTEVHMKRVQQGFTLIELMIVV